MRTLPITRVMFQNSLFGLQNSLFLQNGEFAERALNFQREIARKSAESAEKSKHSLLTGRIREFLARPFQSSGSMNLVSGDAAQPRPRLARSCKKPSCQAACWKAGGSAAVGGRGASVSMARIRPSAS